MKRTVGRPRKKGPKKEQISVTLPKALINEINDKLSYSTSRSKWIQQAIEIKLDREIRTVSDSTVKQLCMALVQREETPTFILRAICSQFGWDFKLVTQVEGTEEAQ